MMNPFTEVNWNPDRPARRKFAVSLMIGFPCLAALFLLAGHFFKGGWKPGLCWLGAGGFAAGLLLWLLPGVAKPFYQAWYFIACCAGFVTGNLLLSAFFYLVIWPIGGVMRAAGRGSLTKGFDKSRATYWDEAEKAPDPKAYFRQF
jgi:hypothetical protein